MVIFKNILIIQHDRFLCLWLCLCSSRWFEVGGVQLEKEDVTNVHAPIRLLKFLNKNLMKAFCLCCQTTVKTNLIEPNTQSQQSR